MKTGYFTSKELDAIANLLNTAGRADLGADKKQSSLQAKAPRDAQLDGLIEGPKDSYRDSLGDNWPGDRWRYRGRGPIGEVPRDRLSTVPHRGVRGHLKALETLENMGVKVYGLESLDATKKPDSEHMHWDNIAGYHEQKRCVSLVVEPLQSVVACTERIKGLSGTCVLCGGCHPGYEILGLKVPVVE